jgi:FMN phosphatase YigB (HAD superfamily)
MTIPAALPARIAGHRAVSCDVFDTAVLRRLARPEDVHLATGARLRAAGLSAHPPDAFRAYRIAAEAAMRRAAEARGDDEPRIAEIYGWLAACGVVADAAAAARAELAAEIAACVASEPLRAALAARPAGQRLVFLSDTVLPGAWVAEILRACGYGEAVEVVTSADAGRSKHSGRLFAHLAATLGLRPADILHIGDNPVSDGANARAAGFATLTLPPPRRPPERAEIAARHPVLRLLHSHRRSAAAQPPEGRYGGLHRHVSLLAIGWTLYILAEARRRGSRRVYFLARDGWLPLAIARRIVARTGEAFDLRYLEVSRRSVVVPATAPDDPGLAEYAGYGAEGRPFAEALDFLGVDRATTAAVIRALGEAPETVIRGREGRARVAGLFAAAPTLIAAHIAARADEARAYLAAAGFLEPGPRVIVDVGWRGTTQEALARLTGLPAEDIAGCYLGLKPEALRPGITPDTTAAYLFGFGHPAHAMEAVMDGYALLELFFSAPHGSVRGYALGDVGADSVAALHAEEAEPAGGLRRAAFAAIEAGVLREFDVLDTLLGGAWETLDATSALHDMLPLLTTPRAADVATINTIPFIHGADGTKNVVAINRMGLRAMLRSPADMLRRAGSSPWRAGWVRLHFPPPWPAMTYATLKDRAARLGLRA